MHKRINVTLPVETVQLLDRVTSKGNRSRLIDTAVKYFVGQRSRRRLRKQLAEGYKRNTRLDLEIATEWFPLEQEVWDKQAD
ncbi:MAG: hypothetical protein HY706_13880 [Candidatus Hydrogenedentes bacterium]|nr:hypothetical protein [Candidatus Hydrogenedentota bacterium]